LIYLIGGKHIGNIASVKEVKNKSIKCDVGKESFNIMKKDVFVVGKDKPKISLIK